MDKLELFKIIGLESQEDADKAMEVFSKEYSNLTGTPVDEVWEVLAPKKDEATPHEGIDVIRNNTRAINPLLVVKNLVKKWFSEEKIPVAQRISMMLSSDQCDIEPVSDYACIAAHVYGNRDDSILPGNWKCLGTEFNGIRLDDPKSSLEAMLYKNDDGNVPRYVYAISGTQDAKDWETNITSVIGISNQHDHAAEAAEQLAEQLGTKNLKIVGHSKGGGQAAYCAMRTGCDAITFNPAGLGLYKYNLKQQTNPRIDSFVMTTDPLNIFQLIAQLIAIDITANGSVHYIKPIPDMPHNINYTHGMDAFLHILGLIVPDRTGDD